MMKRRSKQFIGLILPIFILSIPLSGCAKKYDEAVSEKAHAAFIQALYEKELSHITAQGEGIIEVILKDDTKGSKHQRFIVRLSTGQTLLISHNIDIAPRIPDLKEGERIAFRGEYEWNNKGGVIHWTHHDPLNHRVGGWIEYRNTIYR